MTIYEFLSQKISDAFLHPYEELTDDLKVKEVIAYMQSRRTSSVVLTRSGRACGIFTERDLCNNFGKMFGNRDGF